MYLGNPAGFVIIAKTENKKTLYIMGDTGITMDMKLVNDLYKPAVGIVPIGDRFTMGPDQAAYACREFFKFSTIIPCHYKTFRVSSFRMPSPSSRDGGGRRQGEGNVLGRHHQRLAHE